MSSVEERLAALESEVAALREQVTDAHMLAAHADRDVAEFRAELRAQTRLIQALRETQVEQGATLGAHGAMLAEHGAVLGSLRDGMQTVTGLIQELIRRDDERGGSSRTPER